MKNEITYEKLAKYFDITTRALAGIKENVAKRKEKQAKEIIAMASNYLSDAHFFEKKKDFVNAFASLNYAHGWIDAGVRLGVFNVHDDQLFTIK